MWRYCASGLPYKSFFAAVAFGRCAALCRIPGHGRFFDRVQLIE
jgi:hypothetical protein